MPSISSSLLSLSSSSSYLTLFFYYSLVNISLGTLISQIIFIPLKILPFNSLIAFRASYFVVSYTKANPLALLIDGFKGKLI